MLRFKGFICEISLSSLLYSPLRKTQAIKKYKYLIMHIIRMANGINYPSFEKVIEFNVLAVTLVKAKKADNAKVLNAPRIRCILEECEKKEGDIYDKAIVLLKGIVQQHPFASGNRRTAFILAKYFLMTNRARFGVPDDPEYIGVMQGVRECFYSDEELKEWIKNGKIKQFKR